MLFMVIETFREQDLVPVYERLEGRGRGIPEGLRYIDSWVDVSGARCFQLMECADLRAMQSWVLHWRGTGVTFEIVPVLTGAEARSVVDRARSDQGSSGGAASSGAGRGDVVDE